MVIGVRSSWLMTSMNASRNSPARRSSSEQLIALLLDATTLGDVLAGADHRDRRARPSSRRTRPAPWVQWTDPSGQTTRKSSAKGAAPSSAACDAAAERLPIVGVDHVQVGLERRGLRRRLQAVLAEDRVGPGQGAVGDVPLPEAGPGCREHDLEPRVAGLDLLGERRDLVERIDEPVARGAPGGDEQHRAGRGHDVDDLADELDRASPRSRPRPRKNTPFRITATTMAVIPPMRPPNQAASTAAAMSRM